MIILIVALLLNGCSHSYFYRPEVAGDGAIYAQSGVIYAVPAKKPELKLKLTYVGVTGAPKGLSISDEQKLVFSAGSSIPAMTAIDNKPEVKITLSAQKTTQGVDLFFPLPAGAQTLNEYQSFTLQWAIHCGRTKTENRLVRFDRFDTAPSTGGDSTVDEFGFGEAEGFAPGGDGSLNGGAYY